MDLDMPVCPCAGPWLLARLRPCQLEGGWGLFYTADLGTFLDPMVPCFSQGTRRKKDFSGSEPVQRFRKPTWLQTLTPGGTAFIAYQ